MPEDKYGFRMSNPSLHYFYVLQAIDHLLFIQKEIRKFGKYSNSRMSSIAHVLDEARTGLIKDQKAYEEADMLLQELHKKKLVKYYYKEEEVKEKTEVEHQERSEEETG